MADFCVFSRAAFSAKTKAGRQLASATFAKDSPQVKKEGYGQWRIPAVFCESAVCGKNAPKEYSSRGVLIWDTGIAEALAQLVGNGLSVCPSRRHSVDESSDVSGKILVSVLG
jgi:hypothetical protein